MPCCCHLPSLMMSGFSTENAMFLDVVRFRWRTRQDNFPVWRWPISAHELEIVLQQHLSGCIVMVMKWRHIRYQQSLLFISAKPVCYHTDTERWHTIQVSLWILYGGKTLLIKILGLCAGFFLHYCVLYPASVSPGEQLGIGQFCWSSGRTSQSWCMWESVGHRITGAITLWYAFCTYASSYIYKHTKHCPQLKVHLLFWFYLTVMDTAGPQRALAATEKQEMNQRTFQCFWTSGP